jgi:hypothetical protein
MFGKVCHPPLGVESAHPMYRFSDDREALDFVASQIAEQAQRDGVSLSEVERKMLYFSETAWTLPEILDVSEEFDRDYDQNVYEKKISQLIKKAVSNARKQRDKFEGWTEAIRRLSREDRFLLVMIKQARLGATLRPHRVLWRLWGAGLAGMTLFVSFAWIMAKIFPDSGYHPIPGTSPLGFYIWAAMVCVAVLYGLMRFLVGARKFDHISADAVEWIFGMSKRRK